MLTRNAAPIDAEDRPIPPTRCCGAWAVPLALEHPRSGAGSSTSTNRFRPELAGGWVLAGGVRRRVRGPGRLPRRGATGRRLRQTSRRRPARFGSIRRPAISSSVRRATSAAPDRLSRRAGRHHHRRRPATPETGSTPGRHPLTARYPAGQRGRNDASDPAATLSTLFDRFAGADLPRWLVGVYLAAFGGGPTTLRDMTDADVTAMFGPEAGRRLAAARALAAAPSANSCCHIHLRSARLTVVEPLRGHHHLPGHLRLRASGGLVCPPPLSVGLVEVAGGQPVRRRTADLPWIPGCCRCPRRHRSVRCRCSPVRTPVCCAVVAADWNRLAGAYRTRAALPDHR